MKSKFSQKKVIFDESYRNETSKLQHYVQIGLGTVKTAGFDVVKNQYIEFSEYSFKGNESWVTSTKDFEEFFTSIQVGNNSRALRVVFVDELYTIIPKALFDKEELETYLKFNHPIENFSDYTCKFDRIENLDIVIVYAVPNEISRIIEERSDHLNWNHFSKPLLEAASLRKEKDVLFQIHIQSNRFDVLMLNNNKLKFFNSFPYSSVEDFIYYLLYVMEQLKLDRETNQVELIGEFETNSALYKMLFKYIRHLKIGKRSPTVYFSAPLQELPSHYHFSLFNQHLCE